MMGFDNGGPPQPNMAQPMQSSRPGMPPLAGAPGMPPPQQQQQQHMNYHAPYNMAQQPSPHNMPPYAGPPQPYPHANNMHSPQGAMHMQQQARPGMMPQQQHHSMPPQPLHHHAPQHLPPQQQPPQQHYMQQQQHAPPSQQQQQPPSQQQQQGTMAATTTTTSSWQSNADIPHRREMIQQIVKLIKKDKGGSPDTMNKLPQMAKQLEVSLYRDATSFEAYMDMNTLKKRLQLIAAEVQRKTREGQSGNANGANAGADPRYSNSNNQDHPPQQQQQPNQMQAYPQDSQPMRQDARNNNLAPYASSQQQQQPNPRLHTNGMEQQQQQQQMNPMLNAHQPSRQGYNMPGQSKPMDNRMQQQQQQQQAPRQPQQQMAQQPTNSNDFTMQNQNDPEWKLRVRHKQQRLLLLHHSAKCPAPDGRCTVTPHCADMKRLWKHMEVCKDNDCRVPHCFSSRAILSHYRKCKDVSCPACAPVRDTVRKSKAMANNRMPGTNSNNMGPHGGGRMMHGNSNHDPLAQSESFQSGTSNNMAPYPQQQQQRPMPPANMGAPPNVNRQYPPVNQYQQHMSMNGSSSGPVPNASQPLFHDSELDRGVGAMDASSVTLPAAVAPSRSGTSSQNSEWQKIRHKQQRLLLLRHASKCKHEPGQCPVTPHCASMKKLWGHIAHCKSQQCTVQHCLSSRYVLSHYRRCKDPNCPACAPVRETIRKSEQRLQQQQNGAAGLPLSSMSQQPSSPEMYQQETKRAKLLHEGSVSSSVHSPASGATSSAMAITSDQGKKIDKDASKADYSLLNSFTVKQLETHLESLDRKTQLPPAKLKTKCGEVLKGLQSHQHGWVFNCPVDPIELGLPDYFDIIKKPMDLGTIQKRIENGQYHQLEDFIADCNLTFDNAMTYNEDGSVVYDMAKELKVKLAADVKKLMIQLEAEDKERRQNDRACTLCGCEKLLYEPPVYFCNGINCQSQRIRRNSHFYVGGTSQYFWCSPCFNELDDKLPIDMGDMTIMKGDLKKKKNDEVHEESWVQCDTCERWVHQICGLFNTRQNKEHHSEYCCPRCLCDQLKTDARQVSQNPPSAADLPRTMLSEWLEQHIIKQIAAEKRQIAEQKATAENISLEEATRQVESGGPIVIRQVTSMDRKLEVRELMKQRYAHKNYPDEFPFRCKCLVVFQELDGVDVLLFALYVYEHGEDNPPPNARCIYISYLDSVHFMRPRKLRTFVYHEILIAYLDYARRKGFSTAHIWACPPLKGDDYIFYCKPEDQKTPRDARLRMWYIDMLVECQRRSIVGKVTNMYDLYFANHSLDATAVPYMEGDYFPGEAENIIKMIEEGSGKKTGGGGKKKKGAQAKGSTGTRSTGVDEEALLASGMYDGVKNLKDLDRDQVMVKLGETIQPMKDSFIVAFLNWSGARDEDMVVSEEMEQQRKEYESKKNDLTGSKRDAIGNIRDGIPTLDSDGKPLKIIDDDAEDLDCEVLNNRQAFLNLCRGNHYQFDELRRSKHTSMMVLWHLHNRDAPKFVQQCVVCNREILSGMRYHCNQCPDYDLCQECFKSPQTNRGACNHQLQAIPVENGENQSQSGLTDAERLQRQRNLRLHIQLIEHASRCVSKTCTSSNCQKMKSYLHHSSVCRVKAGGGCKICKRIWTLLRIHAQDCKDRNCPIPQCNAIREKMRQLKNQQQAMDDRRRLEMNRHMRFGGAAPPNVQSS